MLFIILQRVGEHWTKEFSDFTTGFGIIVGGIWVLYQFGLYRERFPSMELINAIHYIGESEREYLMELSCTVENKGKVRKWVAPFDFALLYLDGQDVFITDDIHVNNEVKFKNFFRVKSPTYKLNPQEKKYWVAPDWYIPFVDGNSKRKFTYLIPVPKEVKFLILYTRFVDFNSKKKAVESIRDLESGKVKKGTSTPWNDRSLDEKLNGILAKKSDFYTTQITLSIESIKQQAKTATE